MSKSSADLLCMSEDCARPVIDPSRPVPDAFDLQCEGCGYSLVGLSGDRCPECGRVFVPGELPLARVPWLFRGRDGTGRAYLLTVAMILCHPMQFAREMTRPIRLSPRDAKDFRRLTIRMALIAIALAAAALIVAEWSSLYLSFGPGILRGGQLRASVGMYMGGVIGLWVFLWLATDLPTFIWKGLPANPEDLAPLHHYAIAPVGLVPPALLICAVVGLASVWFYDLRTAIHNFAFSGICGLAIIIVAQWLLAPILMRGATNCSFWRQLLLAIYLPFHWALVAILAILVMVLVSWPLQLS